MTEGTKDGGLTGNRRYQACTDDIAGVPVMLLQVEEAVWNDAAEGVQGRWVCQWRDARPSDLTEQGGFYV